MPYHNVNTCWVNIRVARPAYEGWYWFFIPPDYVERAWYDPEQFTWAISEGSVFTEANKITHWQPYFTPVGPGEINRFLEGFGCEE